MVGAVGERSEILLVRHGRSAHIHAGWVDARGFLRWGEAYEAAGISIAEKPPADLIAAAARAGAIVASDAPRAIESARLLAQGRDVIVSPDLRELELSPPPLPGRMPLGFWKLAFGIRWLWRQISKRSNATEAELIRAGDAARRLIDVSRTHGSVLVVTHGSFRHFLSSALVRSGWIERRRGRQSHWSVWSFSTTAPIRAEARGPRDRRP